SSHPAQQPSGNQRHEDHSHAGQRGEEPLASAQSQMRQQPEQDRGERQRVRDLPRTNVRLGGDDREPQGGDYRPERNVHAGKSSTNYDWSSAPFALLKALTSEFLMPSGSAMIVTRATAATKAASKPYSMRSSPLSSATNFRTRFIMLGTPLQGDRLPALSKPA